MFTQEFEIGAFVYAIDITCGIDGGIQSGHIIAVKMIEELVPFDILAYRLDNGEWYAQDRIYKTHRAAVEAILEFREEEENK